jgi:transcriptional regulator GlxA family with amidase domain
MHVSIIVPAGEAVLSSIVGPYKLLMGINQFLIRSGIATQPFYEIDLVGIQPETLLYGDIFAVRPTKMIHELSETDLVIVTTIFGDLRKELENNLPFVPWIRKMHLEKNADVASLCVGAFLLASTGLVDGKDCSTHWAYADLFRQMFPMVHLVPQRIITEDSGIYSSGGSYSFLNLMLHIIQKHNGKDAANWAAKMFEIEVDRDTQGPFMIFQGQKQHDDLLIQEVQQFIEANYQNPLSLDQLSEQFNLSKRSLIRRFKRATLNTPLQYLQRVKIEAAKRNLEKTNQTISEIMFSSGYNDTKTFRELFKKFVGIPPSSYRNKYGRAYP